MKQNIILALEYKQINSTSQKLTCKICLASLQISFTQPYAFDDKSGLFFMLAQTAKVNNIKFSLKV